MEWDKVYWKQFGALLYHKSPRHKVMVFVMRRGSRGYPICFTVRELSERLTTKLEKVSERTVQTTISFMIKNDMVRRKGNGILYSNPRMVFCGKDALRQSAQILYDKLPCGKKKDYVEREVEDDPIYDKEGNRYDPKTGEIY